MNLDWKNESDYEYVDKLSKSVLAFEFLRRNEGYQAHYQKYSAVLKILQEKHGPYEEAKKQWHSDPLMWVLETPIEEGESLSDWDRRAFGSGPSHERTRLDWWYGAKWGLVRAFPDPSAPSIYEIKFEPLEPFPIVPLLDEVTIFFNNEDIIYYDDDKTPNGQKWGTAVLVFDLQFDIADQLERANKILSVLKTKQAEMLETPSKYYGKNPGNYFYYFKRYLRVLDGAASGATNAKMAPFIFPDEDNTAASRYHAGKKVSATIKQALNFVEFYRRIPFFN